MKRGILLLLLLYVVGVSAIVAGELTNLNGIKRTLGEPEVGFLEYFSANAVRILTSPWEVVRELREENRRLSQLWLERQRERSRKILESLAYRGDIKKGNGETPLQRDEFHNRNWVEKKINTAEERGTLSHHPALNLTLLRSYSELLEALEEELRRWNFRGELYIEQFNGSSLTGLSGEELLAKIEEREERINELARQTGMRKIDYGGVEINRFEGDRYFVFLKEDFGDVTVAWRPKEYWKRSNNVYNLVDNPIEAYSLYNRVHERYRELIGVEKRQTLITIYLWYSEDHWCAAYKRSGRYLRCKDTFTEKNVLGSGGFVDSYAGKIFVHTVGTEWNFVHELTHALDIVYEKNPIAFLGEGFASYMSRFVVPPSLLPTEDMKFQSIKRAELYFNYTIKDFVENLGKIGWSGNGPYDYATLFEKYLIDEYGKEKFGEIYTITNRQDLEVGYNYVNQKFQKVYGKSLEELDREMRAWLEEGGG
jgi:hypothetical protein